MSVLAWPGVVLVAAVVFMVMFRSNIGRFLDRTKSVGKDGVRAYDEPAALPPQQPVVPPNDALLKRLEEYHNPLLREVEENIANDLKARGLTNLNDANKALIKSLAGTQLLLEFERVENTIFASQVAALTFLNPRTPTQLSDIEPFYSAAPIIFGGCCLPFMNARAVSSRFLRVGDATPGTRRTLRQIKL